MTKVAPDPVVLADGAEHEDNDDGSDSSSVVSSTISDSEDENEANKASVCCFPKSRKSSDDDDGEDKDGGGGADEDDDDGGGGEDGAPEPAAGDAPQEDAGQDAGQGGGDGDGGSDNDDNTTSTDGGRCSVCCFSKTADSDDDDDDDDDAAAAADDDDDDEAGGEEDEPDSAVVRRAALFLIDAKEAAPLRKRTSASKATLRMTMVGISSAFEHTILFFALCFMGLAFFEDPCAAKKNSDLSDATRQQLVLVELVCIVFFLLNWYLYLVRKADGCLSVLMCYVCRDSERRTLLTLAVHLGLILIFLLDAVSAFLSNSAHLRFSRLLRGLYLCFTLPRLQNELIQMALCVVQLLDKIVVYLAILAIWSCLGVYLMAGFYNQSPESNIYFYTFDTWFDAFVTLFQTSTLSTLTEVVFVNDYYADPWRRIYSNFFFVPFTIFSVTMLSVMLGSIYEVFQHVRNEEASRNLRDAAASANAAFKVLRRGKHADGVQEAEYVAAMRLVTALPSSTCASLFRMHAERSGVMSLQGFWSSILHADMEAQNRESMAARCFAFCLPGLTLSQGKSARRILFMCRVSSCILAVSNVVLMGQYRQANREDWGFLDRLDNLFWALTALEVSIALVVMGFRRTAEDPIRQLECWVVLGGTSLCFGVPMFYSTATVSSIVGVYRRIRLFRALAVLARTSGLKANLRTMLSIISTVLLSVLLLMIPTYGYAIIGMELYSGKGVTCSKDGLCELAFDIDAPETKKEEVMTAFAGEDDVLQLNFDDFHHSVMSTYMIAVMGGPPAGTFSLYAYASSYVTAVVFFSVLYIVLVFMGMSLVTAKVAEQYSEKIKQNDGLYEAMAEQAEKAKKPDGSESSAKRKGRASRAARASMMATQLPAGSLKFGGTGDTALRPDAALKGGQNTDALKFVKDEGLRVAFNMHQALEDQSDFYEGYVSDAGAIDFRTAFNISIEEKDIVRYSDDLSKYAPPNASGSEETKSSEVMDEKMAHGGDGDRDRDAMLAIMPPLSSPLQPTRTSRQMLDMTSRSSTSSLVDAAVAERADICAVLFLTSWNVAALVLVQGAVIFAAVVIGRNW